MLRSHASRLWHGYSGELFSKAGAPLNPLDSIQMRYYHLYLTLFYVAIMIFKYLKVGPVYL